jgi:hypothetical protein
MDLKTDPRIDPKRIRLQTALLVADGASKHARKARNKALDALAEAAEDYAITLRRRDEEDARDAARVLERRAVEYSQLEVADEVAASAYTEIQFQLEVHDRKNRVRQPPPAIWDVHWNCRPRQTLDAQPSPDGRLAAPQSGGES